MSVRLPLMRFFFVLALLAVSCTPVRDLVRVSYPCQPFRVCVVRVRLACSSCFFFA